MNVVQNLFELSRQQQQQMLADGDAAAGAAANGQQQQFRRQAAAGGQTKLMRLIKAEGDEPNNAAALNSGGSNDSMQTIYANKKQSAPSSAGGDAQQQADGGGQLEQHDASGTANGRSDGDEIDRASRSVGSNRPPLLSGLTRAQFSMLFGGQPNPGSQANSLMNFIKKAEPQRMTFMHFGRRR
jgi:hypothetical protein